MSRINKLKELLWVAAMFGLVAMVLRMLLGLGATTHLSDAMPWGLWKIFNMVAGVALATGGFTMACTFYIFHMEKYRSLVKPAILVAFLGYGSSVFSLLWDIGLPYRIWHPLVPTMWNPHSFLFEVAWCVMLYFTVSVIELSPTILEKSRFSRFKNLGRFLHRIALPFVIFGITLSTLHHTSLGSLFIVSPDRLHPLWYAGNWLPLQFFFSAVGAGQMTVVLVALVYSWLFNRKADMPALEGVARASAYFLVIFFALRMAELTAHNKWGVVFSGGWEGYVFGVEILLQAIIPVALISRPEDRKSPPRLALAAVTAMAGLALHRLDTGIGGYARWLGEYYFPSVAEIAFSAGVYAAAGLVFLFMVQHFEVFDEKVWVPRHDAPFVLRGFRWDYAHVSRLSLLAILAVPVAVLLFSTEAIRGIEPVREPVAPPVHVDVAEDIIRIDGNRNGNAVVFPHKMHIETMGDNESCINCHHMGMPKDSTAACYHCHSDMNLPRPLFDHSVHEEVLGLNKSCSQCHDLDKPKTAGNSRPCYECHDKDMGMKKPPEDKNIDYVAIGYENAIHMQCKSCHQVCTTCHQPKECRQPNGPKMPDCSTCH